jgi:hypothetical protein
MSTSTRAAVTWAFILVVACVVNVVVGEMLGSGVGPWLAAMGAGIAAALVVGIPLDRRLARDV